MCRRKILFLVICMFFVSAFAFAGENLQNFDKIKKSIVQIVISVPENGDKAKWRTFMTWFDNAKGIEKKALINKFKVSGVNPVVVASGVIVSNVNNQIYIATVLKTSNLNELAKNEILYVKGVKDSGISEISSVDIIPTKESAVTLLKVKLVKKNSTAAVLADSDFYMNNAEGKQVYGIGYPTERLSIDTYESSPTINDGIISSTAKDMGGFKGSLIQTNLIVNNGMYGGPLTNTNGEVIGLLDNVDNNESAVFKTLASLLTNESLSTETKIGTSYAIPIKKVKEELDTLNIPYTEITATADNSVKQKESAKSVIKKPVVTVAEPNKSHSNFTSILIGGVLILLAFLAFFLLRKKDNTVKPVAPKSSVTNTVNITDLGSSNGTYLNNVKLQANVPTALKSGDTIRLCSDGPEFIVVSEGSALAVKCTKGDNVSRLFKVTPRGLTIGRENADVIESNSGKVSRSHARIN